MTQENFPAITAEVIDKSPADPANGIPFGTWTIMVKVYDVDGNLVSLASKTPVDMSAPDNLDGTPKKAVIDTQVSKEDPSTYHNFLYTPVTAGTKSLSFTSGNLSAPLSIEVDPQ